MWIQRLKECYVALAIKWDIMWQLKSLKEHCYVAQAIKWDIAMWLKRLKEHCNVA